MTVEKYTPWADGVVDESDINGDKVETDTTFDENKISNGFTAERLPYPTLNRLYNRSDSAINALIKRGVGAGCDDDAHYLDIFSDETSPANLYDPANIFDTTGATLGTLYSVSVGTYNRRHCLFRTAPFVIDIFDVENKNHVESIPYTIIGTAFIGGCVYNGVAYVVVNTSPFSMYAIDITTQSVLWGPVDLSAGSDFSYLKVFMASSTKVGVVQSWVTISSGVDPGVRIIDAATGTIDGGGSGDCGSPSSGQVIGACSNGSYVFLAVYNGSSIILSSMSLSSFGSTGCGWSFPPNGNPTGIAKASFGGISCAGNTIVMTFNDGTNLYYKYTTVQGLVSKMQTGDADLIKKLYSVTFDGLDFWSFGTRENKGGSSSILMLYRLNGARFSGYNSNPGISAIYETYTDGEKYVTGFKATDLYQSSVSPQDVKILSDGDSVFVLGGGQYTISQLKRAIIR